MATPVQTTKGDPVKLESDPEALKVREWRHKLQKAFLSGNRNKPLPTTDEMPVLNALFTTIEAYPMNVDYLNFSKIGKVMRHINLLESNKLLRDEEFHFHDRAKALVDKWWQIVTAHEASIAAEEMAPLEPTTSHVSTLTDKMARVDVEGTQEHDVTVYYPAPEEPEDGLDGTWNELLDFELNVEVQLMQLRERLEATTRERDEYQRAFEKSERERRQAVENLLLWQEAAGKASALVNLCRAFVV
ncbi:hypothetical protein C8R44DRAFT_862652 [Mycena epipterygia]|nr:hypothetical protein C8R44DRAFT_862652 [Mycena epipterygia]